MGRVGWSAWIVFAFMLAPGALAASGTFDVRSDVPVGITGPHTLAASHATFLLQGTDGTASLLISGETGTLDRVVHRAFGYLKDGEPELGVLWEQRVEREALPMDGAFLSLQERRDGFTLLVDGATVTHREGARTAPAAVTLQTDALHVESAAEPPIHIVVGRRDAAPFTFDLDPGRYMTQATAGRVTATGPAEVYIADAVLRYTSDDGARQLRAHFRTEQHPGTIYDPLNQAWLGGGSHTEYVHEYVTLHLAASQVQVQYLDTPAAMYASRPTAVVDGEVLLPAATGTVTVTDDEQTTRHDIDAEDLVLGGHITMAFADADASHGRTDVRGSGDLTRVAYGGSDHGYDWATVAAAGLGAILVAALAWASGALKSVAGAVAGLFPGYARVHGDDVLEHPARAELYSLVQANPGLHFMELCGKVDFGASTLNHHLRVLERNQFVSRVRDGRYCRFFDQRAGLYSRERKHAASVLRNDATAAIVAHIIQHPGIAQRDLADHFGIAPSTVSWHIDRLQREGLVQKQRDRHFTRYYMGQAWSDLPTGELARVGLVA